MADRDLTVRLSSQVSDFNRGMSSAARSVGNFKGKLGLAAAGLAGTAGLAVAMTKATQAAVKFERQVADLAKLVGTEAADPLARSIADLSNQLPVARDRLFEVAEAAARLGIRGTGNIEDFTQVMAEVGVATDVTADQAATSMARLAKVTGTPVTEVRNLASAINEASNTMAVSFSDVLDAAQRAAPGLAQLGASQSEIVALSASMAELSANASRSGTRLNRFASVLQQSDSVEIFAEALGMTVREFERLRDESPGRAVLELARAMGRGGEAARLMGDELGEIALRVLRTLAQQTGQLEAKLGDLNTAFTEGTSIGEEYERFADTAAARTEVLKNRMQDLQTEIGTKLLPTFVATLEKANFLLDALQRLAGAAGAERAISGIEGVNVALNEMVQTTSLTSDDVSTMRSNIEEAANRFDDAGTRAMFLSQAMDLIRNAVARGSTDLSSLDQALGTLFKSLRSTSQTSRDVANNVERSSEAMDKATESARSLAQIDIGDFFSTALEDFPFERMLAFNRRVTETRAEIQQMHRAASEQVRQFVSQVELANIQEEMRRLNQAARSVAGQMTSAFSDIITGSESVVDAIAGMVDGIIQELTRLLIQRQLTQLLFSLIGGGIPAAPDTSNINPAAPSMAQSQLPGFQHGGSFRVAGAGGPDSQLVAFRATPGEEVNVQPPDRGGRRKQETTIRNEVNVNINAVDAKSVRRLVQENGDIFARPAIQAMNESLAARNAAFGG